MQITPPETDRNMLLCHLRADKNWSWQELMKKFNRSYTRVRDIYSANIEKYKANKRIYGEML